MVETIKLTMEELDKDYRSVEKRYPELHCIRSNWDLPTLFRKSFSQGHGTLQENGSYRIVDIIHLMMIENISIDISMYGITVDPETPVKIPDLDLSSVDLIRATSDGLVFGNKDGETTIGFNSIIPIIKTFGKPTLIESNPDMPIRITYGDMRVFIAPFLYNNGFPDEVYDIDLKAWLPEYYGLSRNNLTKDQVMNILISMDSNTTVFEAIKQINKLENKNQSICKNSNEYF